MVECGLAPDLIEAVSPAAAAWFGIAVVLFDAIVAVMLVMVIVSAFTAQPDLD